MLLRMMVLVLLGMPAAVLAQLHNPPLVSASAGGILSGTFVYANRASFTALSVGGVAVTGGGGGSSDRIVGTNANAVAANGTISFTTGGVSGTAYFDTVGRLVLPGISATTNQASFTTVYASGNMQAGAYLHNSDLNLKEHVQVVSESRKILDALRGVRFEWKGSGKPSYGVIAQDVQQVMPEAVVGANGTLKVDYDQLIAPLIEAVKQQQRELEALRRELDDLRRRQGG